MKTLFNKVMKVKTTADALNVQIMFSYSREPFKIMESLLDLPTFCINKDDPESTLYLWNNDLIGKTPVARQALLNALEELVGADKLKFKPGPNAVLNYFGQKRILHNNISFVTPAREFIHVPTIDDPMPQMVQTFANGVSIHLWEAPVFWNTDTDYDIVINVRSTRYVGVIVHPDYEVRDFLHGDLITTVQNSLKLMLNGYDANLV